MTSKKPHPALIKKRRKSSKPSHQKWLLAMLILPIFILGYLFLSQPSSDTTVTPMVSPPTTTEQTAAAQAANPVAVDPDATSETDDIEAADASDTNALDLLNAKAIINAPLPQNDSLAKEELDRLADQRERLQDQEKAASEQIAMTKQLTEMKAEQIELLEQQIAELEAKTAAP